MATFETLTTDGAASAAAGRCCHMLAHRSIPRLPASRMNENGISQKIPMTTGSNVQTTSSTSMLELDRKEVSKALTTDESKAKEIDAWHINASRLSPLSTYGCHWP
eukprot:2729648-Prymnesium_polylepis.2